MPNIEGLDLKTKILQAIDKFNLNLNGKVVLTEAATGNYVVTPVIAAKAGAKVYAFTKNSKYGTVEDVKSQTLNLAKELHVAQNINIVTSLENVPLEDVDILTNTGFLRPINKKLIKVLNSKCVIPLMWEPWEFRPEEIDIDACVERGIKVYGTNESDPRLKTMDYIGWIVLYWLLDLKITPMSGKVLVLGTHYFTTPISKVLEANSFYYKEVTNYNEIPSLEEFNVIVVAEYTSNNFIIGSKDASYIDKKNIGKRAVIHISGNVDLSSETISIPDNPKPFPYMSFTTDFVDSKAVVGLHAAGLKVGEGMIEAKDKGLTRIDYKSFMENYYNAKAFDEPKYF